MDIIELEKSLSELHKELARLSPAIKLAEKAVETTDLAKAIPERHQQLIKELKAVFVNPDESEKKEFVNVYTSIKKLQDEIIKENSILKELVQKISELTRYLQDNDIPKKLDAINFQLTGISNSLLSIQNLLTSLSNLAETIKRNSENIIS